MGRASVPAARTPTLRLEFVDPVTSKSLGTRVELISTIVQYNHDFIPSYSSGRGLITAVTLRENASYYQQLAAYIRTREFFREFKLQVASTSGELAEDVVLHLTSEHDKAKFSCDNNEVRKPKKEGLNYDMRAINYRTAYDLKNTAASSSLQVHFGNVRPKAIVNPPGYFSVGSHSSTNVKMEGFLYGNNIPEPIPVALEIDVVVRQRELLLEELEK